MGIFKAYDIRGIYGEEIGSDTAYRLGCAFASVSNAETVLVGYDARTHSRELYRRLVEGLVHGGKRVSGAGMTSTPALHFSQIQRGDDAAVMVTASHNPAEYHGFKFFGGDGGTISYRKGLDRVESAFLQSETHFATVEGGAFREVEALDGYIDFLERAAEGTRFAGKVVVDISNGSAGGVFNRLAEKLGLDMELVNVEPNGEFPHHPPNPLDPESRRFMGEKVREAGADLGALLDGDGDRIIFVDDEGEVLEGYLSAALIAEELFIRRPGAAVVYDLISSRALPERIEEIGGRPIVSRVGYTFIHDRMVETDAIVASETSGHFYFRIEGERAFYTESAAYALLVMLRLLARRAEKLSTLVGPLRRRYSQAPERNLRVSDKRRALECVERAFSEGEISRLDGLSVAFSDFWFNLRPSNTEPLLRLRVEAVDRETARGRSREIAELIKSEVGYEN